MTPMEILALIFAIAILLKFVILAFNPKSWINASSSILKEGNWMVVVYLILAVVVGKYIFASLNIIQVGAVMLFTSLLMGLTMLPYSNEIIKLGRTMVNKNTLEKAWLSVLIWSILAIWVLFTLFA